MSINYWDKRHVDLQADTDWANRASLFAESVIGYFPPNSQILEEGGGQGQDARFFAGKGHSVVSLDFSEAALRIASSALPVDLRHLVEFRNIDFSSTLPFENESFDVVYSHLSLHYFDDSTTRKVFSEIHRVLKPGGLIVILVNSTKDPEFQEFATSPEDNILQVNGIQKRFFDIESMRRFACMFTALVLDDKGTTHRDNAKGIFDMIRFIGKKVPNK